MILTTAFALFLATGLVAYNAYIPGYFETNVYPSVVSLIGAGEDMPDYIRADITVERGSVADTHFEYGYTYVPMNCAVEYVDDTLTVTSTRFFKFSANAIASWSFHVPYAFSLWSVGVTMLDEWNYQGVASCYNGTKGTPTYEVFGNNLRVETTISYSGAGPYYAYLTESAWNTLIDGVAATAASNEVLNRNSSYNRGFEDGKEVGRSAGYQAGFYDGTHQDNSIIANLSALFGAVIDIPIDLLNGLSGLVIWNIPVISVAMTFLFLGIVIWIIKRFI